MKYYRIAVDAVYEDGSIVTAAALVCPELGIAELLRSAEECVIGVILEVRSKERGDLTVDFEDDEDEEY